MYEGEISEIVEELEDVDEEEFGAIEPVEEEKVEEEEILKLLVVMALIPN